MIRRQVVALCFLTFISASALLIGAASLGPKVPLNGAISVVPLALPAMNAPEATSVQEPETNTEVKQIGVASWYGDEWQGHVMASGQRFDDKKMTAAHRTLPLNSQVRVTNLKTGRSVDVTITDRGPYVHGRVIDLSKAAARKLGMVKKGLAPVQITSIALPEAPASPQANTKVASLDVR
jgi:rare lipoprotein A